MSFKLGIFNKKYIYIAGIIFLVLSFLCQVQYDSWSKNDRQPLDTTYNILIEPQPIDSNTAKYVSFGFNEFLADYYWLSFIQYYGGGDPYGKYRKMPDLFNNITELSPKFLDAYQTGLIIMPGEGFVDEAIALGNKGMINMPDRWEVPYYTGLVYHIYKKDYLSAAKLFEKAASYNDAPANAKYFAGIYYNKADQRETSYQMFKTIYDSTKDESLKARVKYYMVHLEEIFYLQDAVKTYQDKYKKLPTNLDQLVTSKIVPAIPDDPLNYGFIITSSGDITEAPKKN